MDDRLDFLATYAKDGEEVRHLPIECTFPHRLDGLGGGETAMHYWPSKNTDGPPEQLTLFILGNPGSLGYYPPFLNHLHDLLPPTHALLAMSHVGHSPSLAAPQVPLTLDEQIDTKIEVVQAIRSTLDELAIDEHLETGQALKSPRLALMGHSVGAYILTRVIKSLNGDGIHAGYMLFPTVGWISQSWNGKTLFPIFHQPLRSLLPVLSHLIRPILPLTTFPQTTLDLLYSPRTIQHTLALAKSEMETIRQPDLPWFKTNVHKDPTRGLFGVWSGGNLDGWVGREGAMVRECLGGEWGGRVRVLDGVPHAFCLSQAHSEIVAEVVASWINPLQAGPRGKTSVAPPYGSTKLPM
ncbi:hypothetical protein BCR39DRAFT_374879 [Naematelia encephala]|uniref:Alpha/Beta hydrolase protein n=1 Tax=Naematelia encephala TaxID=71784 RepID=A0A1Y2BD88_9TREE|nr:hypothetical protein BCR39DRAFT_374879 [Naematelia encephala]